MGSSPTLLASSRSTSPVVLPSVTRRRPRIRSLSPTSLPACRWRKGRGRRRRVRVGSAAAPYIIAAARGLRASWLTLATRPRLMGSLSMRLRRQMPVVPPRRRTRLVSAGPRMRRASSRCKAGASGGCALRVGALRLAVLRRAHRRSSLQSSKAHATAVCASDMFVRAASTRRAATAAGLKGTMPRSAPIAVETSASVGDPRFQRGSVGLLRGIASDRDTRRGAWVRGDRLWPRRFHRQQLRPRAPSVPPLSYA